MSIRALSNKYIKKAFNLFGLHLNRYNFHHSDDVLLMHIIKEFKINTVIDGGANEGQYALHILDGSYKGKIYSFEPIPSVYEKLKKNTLKFSSQWEAVNFGLGSKEENLTIHVTENLVSSSLFEVGENSLEAEPDTKMVRSEIVKITTLNNFLTPDKRDGNILLKLDVQGYELEALKGSLNLLSEIKVIQVELSMIPLYKDAPLYDEVIEFLKQHGFDIFTIIPGFRNPQSGRLLQADGVFLRR